MYSALLFNTEDPIWHNPQLRRAVAHAIDTRQFRETFDVQDGRSPAIPASERTIRPYPFDPSRAAAILDEEGWRMGGSGIRQKDGEELELRILIDERSRMDRIAARIIRQNLAEVGVRAKVLLYSDEKELTMPLWQERRPQAWVRLVPDPDFLGVLALEFWYSYSHNRGKIWKYRNQRADMLFERIEKEKSAAKIAMLTQEMCGSIYEDQPASYLFLPKSLFAVSARFANTSAYFTNSQPTFTIKDWYITPTNTQP